MGISYYMAPELWSDDEPDARSRNHLQLRSAILFQMLAGDVPFKGPFTPPFDHEEALADQRSLNSSGRECTKRTSKR